MQYLAILVDDLIEVITNMTNASQRKPYHYGTDILICVAEIHMLVFIADNPGLKTSEIAKHVGLAKSVVSKTASRLIAKNLIKKYRLPDNKKDIYYRLTDKGILAYQGHQEVHEKCFHNNWTHFSSLSEHDQRVIVAFLNDYIRYLDQAPEEYSEVDSGISSPGK